MSDDEDKTAFAAALKNRTDVTDIYSNKEELTAALLGESPQIVGSWSETLRSLLKKNIGLIAKIPEETKALVSEWMREGKIGAVDGTDAVSQTVLPDRIVYGSAIASMTSQVQIAPVVTVTKTYRPQKEVKTVQSIMDFLDTIEAASEDKSWTQSYREQEERKEAMRLVAEYGCELVLIDGPLYTQNLLTQPQGRVLLSEMQSDKTRYIGFIKEMSPTHRQLGAALQSGE